MAFPFGRWGRAHLSKGEAADALTRNNRVSPDPQGGCLSPNSLYRYLGRYPTSGPVELS